MSAHSQHRRRTFRPRSTKAARCLDFSASIKPELEGLSLQPRPPPSCPPSQQLAFEQDCGSFGSFANSSADEAAMNSAANVDENKWNLTGRQIAVPSIASSTHNNHPPQRSATAYEQRPWMTQMQEENKENCQCVDYSLSAEPAQQKQDASSLTRLPLYEAAAWGKDMKAFQSNSIPVIDLAAVRNVTLLQGVSPNSSLSSRSSAGGLDTGYQYSLPVSCAPEGDAPFLPKMGVFSHFTKPRMLKRGSAHTLEGELWELSSSDLPLKIPKSPIHTQIASPGGLDPLTFAQPLTAVSPASSWDAESTHSISPTRRETRCEGLDWRRDERIECGSSCKSCFTGDSKVEKPELEARQDFSALFDDDSSSEEG